MCLLARKPFQKHALENIVNEPDQKVLDPSWCVDNCPYGSGSLETQRYTLLKRLYQIQLQIDQQKHKRKNEISPSLEAKLDQFLNSVS